MASRLVDGSQHIHPSKSISQMVPRVDGTRFLTGGPCGTFAQVEAFFAARIRFAVRRIGACGETSRREDNMSKMKESRV